MVPDVQERFSYIPPQQQPIGQQFFSDSGIFAMLYDFPTKFTRIDLRYKNIGTCSQINHNLVFCHIEITEKM